MIRAKGREHGLLWYCGQFVVIFVFGLCMGAFLFVFLSFIGGLALAEDQSVTETREVRELEGDRTYNYTRASSVHSTQSDVAVDSALSAANDALAMVEAWEIADKKVRCAESNRKADAWEAYVREHIKTEEDERIFEGALKAIEESRCDDYTSNASSDSNQRGF